MKKIGIVGGVAWRSTVDYYSEICSRSEARQLRKDSHALPAIPEFSIESLDLAKAVSFLSSDDDDSWQQFDEYHRSALHRLEANGADFALIASNTCHHRFADIVRDVSIPVISIIGAAAEQCARMGVHEALILGTPLTMRSEKFREGFEKLGIAVAGPGDEAVRAATAALIAELQLGEVQRAAQRLAKIVRHSLPDRQRPTVCLACTELPLAFPAHKMLASFEIEGIRYVNHTAAHIDAAFRHAFDLSS